MLDLNPTTPTPLLLLRPGSGNASDFVWADGPASNRSIDDTANLSEDYGNSEDFQLLYAFVR